MLRSKNFILLFFGIAITAGFLFSYTHHLASSSDDVVLKETGKVLGVSEQNEDIPKVKNYLALDELEEIIPIIDKSNFIPFKKEGAKDPVLSWGSIVAVDVNSGEILYGREENQERSIASITKLATALVLMDLDIDWDSIYEIQHTDRIDGGRIYIYQGEKIKLKDLLYVSLVASANTATRSLVSASGLSYDEFVTAMNEKAKDLGLSKTHFVDPIGISSLNVSTAREISKLAQSAIQNGVIRDCLLRNKYVFSPLSAGSKTVRTTNVLLDNFQNRDISILGGKTGFTGAAGYCFTGMFEGRNNNKVITVVLGSRNHSARFSDTEKLINWVYGNYEWRR
jgi:D-alanyl-D-alanine carboxypeptidase